MQISACTLLCYPYTFNFLFVCTHVINKVCTKHVIVLNKPTSTTTTTPATPHDGTSQG